MRERAQFDPDALARIAVREGWQAAVHDYLRARDPAAYRYATDPQTATWRLLLAPAEDARVLLLCPGLGVAPFLFAQEGAQVSCACASPAEAEYLRARASQQGLQRLSVCVWDGESPLAEADGRFDLLAAVGGGVRGAVLLREARRLLREGGELFWAGSRRELRPSECRPRLEAQGFVDLRAYGLIPSHRQPFFIVPLWSNTALEHCLGRLAQAYDFSEALPPAAWAAWRALVRRGWRTLQGLRLTGAVCRRLPAYGLVARRNAGT